MLNPVFNEVLKERRNILTEVESKQFLKKSGIPVINTYLARTRSEVIDYSEMLEYPLAMKIISPDIIHKSDIGGVKLNIKDSVELINSYDEIIKKSREHFSEAVIQGVSIQRMADPGVEIIIGMFKDVQFGPLLMFGLGGTMVEVLKDVSFRIVPVTETDVYEMVREVKCFSLLKGYRGSQPVDITYLEKLLMNISQLIENNPEIKELDLNPVIAYKEGAVVVDSRIVLENEDGI